MEKQTENALNNAAANGAGRRKKSVTIDDKEYILQHPGAIWYLKLMDRCKDSNGNLQAYPYSKELIENVAILPKVKIGDFDDDLGGLNKLVEEIESFLTSKAQPTD